MSCTTRDDTPGSATTNTSSIDSFNLQKPENFEKDTNYPKDSSEMDKLRPKEPRATTGTGIDTAR